MFTDKFVRKYLRLARHIGEDQNPCHSRQIGCVIVSSYDHRVLSTGYNGPPAGTPHCDSAEYLRDCFWPQLTAEEKINACISVGAFYGDDSAKCDNILRTWFVTNAAGCGKCPRRLAACVSGERLTLCSCAHAEANAIARAGQPLADSSLFCWSPLPCLECAKLVIAARIREVHCLMSHYKREGFSAYAMFRQAGVLTHFYDPEFVYAADTQNLRLPLEVTDPKEYE